MTLEYRHKQPEKTIGEKPPLLLLLHGIGADENDLFGIIPFLDKRFFSVSARAPFSLGYGGYSWFDLTIEPDNISINVKQAEQSRKMILEFIDELIVKYNLDTKGIYLCGFSQGAAMSLSAALNEPEKLTGIVAMSGRALPEMLPHEQGVEKLKDFPIFVTHGVYDPVLPIDNGRATREILSHLPVDLEYKEYPMGHEISQESLRDASSWLRMRLDEGSNSL